MSQTLARRPRWKLALQAGFWFFLIKGLAWLIVPTALAWYYAGS